MSIYRNQAEAEAESFDAKFAIGDIVALKSGGPPMTVVSVDEYEDDEADCNCWWFTDGEMRGQEGFPESAIEKRLAEKA